MKKPLLEKLSLWLPVVIAIATGLVMWGSLQSTVSSMGMRLTTAESKIESQTTSQSAIQSQLAQIQTDILWIKEKLSNK